MLLAVEMKKTSVYLSVLFCLLAQTSATRSRSEYRSLFRPADYSRCHSNKSSSLNCGVGIRQLDYFWPRIIGGVDAKPGEFPYQAFLDIRRPSGTWRCGGVIIDERHVLTAAHCLMGCNPGDIADYRDVNVGIGEHSIETRDDGEFVDQLEGFVIHEDFARCDSYIGDIAMLKTRRRMKFGLKPDGYGSVNRVCMPDKNDQHRGGEKVTISGWGFTDPNDHRDQDILQKAEIQISDFKGCQKAWNDIELDEKRHICGWQPGGIQSSCQGDSGSPLLKANRDGHFTAIGITSYGTNNCNNNQFPTLYTRISYYSKWIENQIRQGFKKNHPLRWG